jgi:hypothetical protein
MRLRSCFLLFALTCSVGWAQVATPPRDATGPAKPGGVVRGKVVNSATNLPLHRVKITLNGDAPNAPVAVTDTRGEFEVADVPPGTYTLTASRAGFLSLLYGQRRPREAGRPFEVKAGNAVDGLQIAMFRSSVLAGRVSDEQGDPAPGARVEAVEFRYINGRRIPVAAAIGTANDIGEFRLGGLNPGAYQLRVSTTEAWDSDDGKTTFVHAVTYFPGVTGADQAQTITLNLAQEVGDLDVRLVAGRAARLTGVVEDASGAPMPSQEVHLSRITRGLGGALQSSGPGATARTDARGAFEMAQLAPGEYSLYSGGPADRVSIPVLLNEGDVKHVVITPRRATAVSGSIVSDDGSPLPFAVSRLTVVPVQVDAEHVLRPWGAPGETSVAAKSSFRLTNMQGQYLFRLRGLPSEWMLKSVVVAGRDMTDAPLPIAAGAPDIEGVQLVISRGGGAVTGVVETRTGSAAADATVVVFSESRAHWGAGSRFIRTVRPDLSGRFVLHALPPATYRVAARDFIVDGQWEDPEFLQSIMRDAIRVELAEGATKDVKIVLEVSR